MSLESTDLRSRITLLTQSSSHQGALLEGLEALTKEDDFAECADVWAPTLYQRNPLFFQAFLLRHLDKSQALVIRQLLGRAEADGYDTLFVGLYPKVIGEAEWNDELRAYIEAVVPDAQIAPAIARRAVPDAYYTLDEANAASLYQRNPALFGGFVRDHIRPGEIWQEQRRRTYAALRAAAQARGDDELYWWIFRAFADGAAWQEAMRELRQQAVPDPAIASTLAQRQPMNATNVDTSPLVEIVERYGPTTFPYIDANLNWIGGKTALRLLPVVEQGGDIALYRKIFFQFGDQGMWQREIRNLLATTPSDDDLASRLARWTPPVRGTERFWWLKNDTALELYRRDPTRLRPFLLRVVHDPDVALFLQAEQQGDEEFLDFLTAAYLDQLSTAITYKPAGQQAITQEHVNKKTSALLASFGPHVIARFERLAAQSPLLYVQHAARIVSDGLGVVSFLGDDVAHNPITYLKARHHAAWRQSPVAMRDVLETPNANVARLGMEILAAGDGDAAAAQRVVENVLSLQAVLLGTASQAIKKLALRCLQNAAAQGSPYAERILPALAETMHFHSNSAIAERIMVGFVRARRAAAARQSA